MKTIEIVNILKTKHNGSAISMKWNSDLAKSVSATAKKNGYTVTKEVSAVVRKGISYENQACVKKEVENGKVLTHELPWGQWSAQYENIIEHKGKEYVRLYFILDENGENKGISAPKTKYFVNGIEKTYEELKNLGIMVNSFFNKKDEAPKAITVNVENVIAIK